MLMPAAVDSFGAAILSTRGEFSAVARVINLVVFFMADRSTSDSEHCGTMFTRAVSPGGSIGELVAA